MHHDIKDFKACIELCWQCRDTCQKTLYNHCLQMGGRHTAAAHIRIMADCIQMCQTCADFMTRGSELHMATCLACAVQTHPREIVSAEPAGASRQAEMASPVAWGDRLPR